MNIKKFSEATKLTAYTVRYYEKMGLLKNISRNSSGHRWFTEQDIVWVAFIKRLKDTGMPLEGILKYAELREQGISTSEQRMKMLQDHALKLEENITEQQLNLKKLQQKITYYSDVIKVQ
ncbi:MerR family transcriptional regulator [Vibrio sp. 2-Bac 85]|uniref:MerR family transcriptional regulator n=1 Tax=Psychromonas sp. SA13A TaxID=2686346 RepID=UPI0014099395|nr:MerR family transcriptional regulator [Psychromonas sp. SA13A]